MVRSPHSWPLLAAVIATVVFWATPPPARAGFEVTFTDVNTGQTYSQTGTGSITVTNLTVGNFYINLSAATTNSPGATSGAYVTILNSDVLNTSSTTDTLKVAVSATGFSTPGGVGVELINTVSGTIASGTVSNGNFTSYVDTSNTLFGTSGATVFSTPAVTFSGTGPTSFSGTTVNNNIVTVGSNYSITAVGSYTTTGGSEILFSGGEGETVVPAPSGLTLALSGFPLLGFGGWFWGRKRRV